MAGCCLLGGKALLSRAKRSAGRRTGRSAQQRVDGAAEPFRLELWVQRKAAAFHRPVAASGPRFFVRVGLLAERPIGRLLSAGGIPEFLLALVFVTLIAPMSGFN
jgi:hypothetical protein